MDVSVELKESDPQLKTRLGRAAPVLCMSLRASKATLPPRLWPMREKGAAELLSEDCLGGPG